MQDRLFRAALSHGINTDIEVEFLLTALRRALLEAPDRLRDRPVYEFACVLIQQCANNGYVFVATDEERARLAKLEVDAEALFDGKAAVASDFMLAGLYKRYCDARDTRDRYAYGLAFAEGVFRFFAYVNIANVIAVRSITARAVQRKLNRSCRSAYDMHHTIPSR